MRKPNEIMLTKLGNFNTKVNKQKAICNFGLRDWNEQGTSLNHCYEKKNLLITNKWYKLYPRKKSN